MRWSMLLAFMVTACGVGPGPCRPEKLVELPVIPRLRVPYVQATINGQAADLLIDTGANMSVLTAAAARRLGVVPTGVRAIGLGVGGSAVADLGHVTELRLGALTAPGADVAISDLLRLPGDGVLGLNVLKAYQIELDTPRRRISFYTSPSCPDPRPDWTGSFHELEVRPSPFGFLMVQVSANGITLPAVLDTGASLTALSLRQAGALGLSVSMPPGPVPAVGQRVGSAILRDLRIGGEETVLPVVGVASLPSSGIDAIVGNDWMARRRVWLSFNPGRVFATDQPRPR